MASFGHTFGHTLCRDATLGHSPTIPRIKVAPHIGRGVVARLDRPINPVVVRFCFRKWMPRRATLCPFDLTRDGARSTKLQIPIGVSSQFVAPSFDYGCCSQLEYFMASLFALFVWEKTLDRGRKFERSRIGKKVKKEIPSGISVLWYLEHFFSLQSNFHSWSIFFSSTNRKTLRNRGAIVLALTLGHFVPSYDSCNCIALRKPPTWTNPPRDKYLPISRPWEWTIISLRLWICESSPNIPEFDFTFNPRYRSIAKLRSNFIFRSIRKIGYYFPFFSAWKNHRPWKGKKEKKFSISSDATSNRGLK